MVLGETFYKIKERGPVGNIQENKMSKKPYK